MALIRNARGRRDGGSGYARVLDDQGLGQLISRVQATVISSGSELERIICDRVAQVENLDRFLEQEIMQEGVMLASKRAIKRSNALQFHGAEPDFLVFKRRGQSQRCHVIELKDGDMFDTKKAAAEHRSAHSFVEKNARNLQYLVSVHFVAFNQTERTAIFDGFKRKVPERECMTGPDFCNLLEIDYDEIVRTRQSDWRSNFEYFLDELLEIPRVRNYLGENLSQDEE